MFGIIGGLLTIGTVLFSIVAGVAFYPAAEQGLAAVEEAGVAFFYFYTVYFFVAFTHAVSSIVVIIFAIYILIVGIYRLIKVTIFTDARSVNIDNNNNS